MNQLLARCLLLAVALAACSSAPVAPADAVDADAGAWRDAGDWFDAGPDSDAGEQLDSGSAPDAGEQPDASEPTLLDSTHCARYGEPADLGPLPAPLAELSGLAASRKNPGVLWAHNDSGSTARLFALGLDGSVRATLELEGLSAIDWEDLAIGPCPAGDCLFVGDIGDNQAKRTNVSVVRVPEPDLSGAAAGATLSTAQWEALPFRYAGGKASDAETLLVHPSSGDVFVVTKVWGGTSAAWRFPQPLTPGAQAELVKVADLPEPSAQRWPLTGGDIHPSGDALLLRTYDALLLLRQPAGEGFEAIFTAPAVELPVAAEPQGEAVAWRADGLGYYTASERAAEKLHGVGCR